MILKIIVNIFMSVKNKKANIILLAGKNPLIDIEKWQM